MNKLVKKLRSDISDATGPELKGLYESPSLRLISSTDSLSGCTTDEVIEALNYMMENVPSDLGGMNTEQIKEYEAGIVSRLRWAKEHQQNPPTEDAFRAGFELANLIYDLRQVLGHGADLYRGQTVLAAAASGGRGKISSSSEYGSKLRKRDEWILFCCSEYRERHGKRRVSVKELRNFVQAENNKRENDSKFVIPGLRQFRVILHKYDFWHSAGQGAPLQ